MERVVTVRWRTVPPAAVEEDLAVYRSRRARLLVVRPREGEGTVGTYAGEADPSDLDSVSAWGPGPFTFDLLGPVEDPEQQDRLSIADRVAAAVRSAPLAVATFRALPLGPAPSGLLRVALMITASGTRAVAFEFDPAKSAVLFTAAGAPLATRELPDLHMGFLTAMGDWIGGLRDRGTAKPGQTGTIALDVDAPAGATHVAISVVGSIHGGLPDEPVARTFSVRTADAPIADEA